MSTQKLRHDEPMTLSVGTPTPQSGTAIIPTAVALEPVEVDLSTIPPQHVDANIERNQGH